MLFGINHFKVIECQKRRKSEFLKTLYGNKKDSGSVTLNQNGQQYPKMIKQ